MYGTRSGCSSHHRVRAFVHWRARSKSEISWQASIVLQYTIPAGQKYVLADATVPTDQRLMLLTDEFGSPTDTYAYDAFGVRTDIFNEADLQTVRTLADHHARTGAA